MSSNKNNYKKLKKDYQSKNLCNPFFRKPKKNLNKKFFGLIIFLASALIAGIFWFFWSASFWDIKEIKIEGLTRLAKEEIEDRIISQFDYSALGLFKQHNIFLLSVNKLHEEILDNYNFSNVEISKKLPATLIVKISERPYAFIFEQGSELFYASRDAYVIKDEDVSDENKEKYFVLENRSNNNLINSIGKISLPEAYLEFAFNLADYLRNSQEVEAEKYIIDVELNTIKVKFKDGPEVYFNTRSAADDQLDRLILVKKEKIKDNFSTTNYIDLRYGDKIFIN